MIVKGNAELSFIKRLSQACLINATLWQRKDIIMNTNHTPINTLVYGSFATGSFRRPFTEETILAPTSEKGLKFWQIKAEVNIEDFWSKLEQLDSNCKHWVDIILDACENIV
jgi:hypothetical protein